MFFPHASFMFISPSILPTHLVTPPNLMAQPSLPLTSLTSPVPITVLFLFKMYTTTTSKPTYHISSSITSLKGVYSQLLPQSRCSCISMILWATLF